jgi:diphthine synthase
MGQLWFIGVGLCDEQDLSRRGLALLREADAVFAEVYTSTLNAGSMARLSKEIDRPIRTLSREELEDETILLSALRDHEKVALLVAGDPFAATTHVAIRVAAERAGHAWAYLPNASILTAAASFLGLMHYRFGRTVSLPLPAPGFTPRSPIEFVERNRAQNLHTLVLLDLRPEEGTFLTAPAALEQIDALDPTGSVVPPSLALAVVARVGSASAQGWYGTGRALRTVDFGPPLHALVVPAPELHFEEEAALQRYTLPGADRPS